MSDEPYVHAIARTMARSKYPLAWFENYPKRIYEQIKNERRNHENQEPVRAQA
jgi:hypothetical protein